jgi:hypothetical protein
MGHCKKRKYREKKAEEMTREKNERHQPIS